MAELQAVCRLAAPASSAYRSLLHVSFDRGHVWILGIEPAGRIMARIYHWADDVYIFRYFHEILADPLGSRHGSRITENIDGYLDAERVELLFCILYKGGYRVHAAALILVIF